MTKIYELETERLRLRQWTVEDYPAFAELNGHAEVMEHFPNTLSQTESDNFASKVQNMIEEQGWGLWAMEEKSSQSFMGYTGLNKVPETLPFSPALEIGWRMSNKFWGKGYATEAAKKVLEFSFTELEKDEICSFTAVTNKKSSSVMERIGMTNLKRNFMHPHVADGHRLKEHVLYTITQSQWKQLNS